MSLHLTRSLVRKAFLTLGLVAFPALLSATTFSGWQTANFTSTQLADSTISGATADPDADGTNNLQEYVFFGSPLTSEANLQPKLELISGTLALTYRERQGMSDVNIRLQGSDTLMNWITFNTVTEAERVSRIGYDEVTLLDPVAFSGTKRFLRLSLQLTPVPALSAPYQLSLTVNTPTAWTVSWTDPNTTEVGYAVESQDKTTGAWNRLVTLGADIGTWQHTTANYQISTTYRVVTIGADGTELDSDPITLSDTDSDGIPNAFELGVSYTGLTGTYASDPNTFSTNGSGVSDGWLVANGYNPAAAYDPATADTDGDGVPDALDGWPLTPWIKTAPLPEVRYAVLRFPASTWPAGAYPTQLSDNADVLANVGYYDNPKLWRADQAQIVSMPDMVGVDCVLSPTGQVVGTPVDFTGFEDHPPYAVWTKEAGTAVYALSLSPYTGLDLSNITQLSPRAMNSAGTMVFYYYEERRAGTYNVELRGGVYGQAGQLDWLGGKFTQKKSTGTVITDTGYLPASINDDGLVLADILKAYTANFDYQSPGCAIIGADGQTQATFPKGTGEITPMQITSGAVSAAFMNAIDYSPDTGSSNLHVVWAHQTGPDHAWASETLRVWDPSSNAAVSSLWFEQANNRLEIIGFLAEGTNVSKYVLIRNGAIVPSSSYTPDGWANVSPFKINNSGVMLASATRTVDDQGQPIASPTSEPVLLVPIEIKVVNRDDPTKQWTDARNYAATQSLYAGEFDGDMVSWKWGGSEPSTTMFTWTAQGPGGEIINGPAGPGKNEWKIADGDDDTANDWLKWKPGRWKIKVQVGSMDAEFTQDVGWRTDDYVVIGQIVPTHTYDGEAPAVVAVGNNFWDVSSPVALYRRALLYDMLDLPVFDGATDVVRDALTVTPLPITAKLTEAWFGYWFLISPSVTPQGPFASAQPSGNGSVQYGHRFWALQHVFNVSPDFPLAPESFTSVDFDALKTAGQYRVIHRYKSKFMITADGKIAPSTVVPIQHVAEGGPTKLNFGIAAGEFSPIWNNPAYTFFSLPKQPSETNLYQGTQAVSTDGTKLSYYATGRVGPGGQNVNWRLMGKDAPWIFSEIITELKPDRTVNTVIKTSIDKSWSQSTGAQGNHAFNNLNLYKKLIETRLDGSYKITFERKDLLPMEGQMESFINSASGQRPEPPIPPSRQ